MNNYNTLLKVNLRQIYAIPKDDKERKKAIGKYACIGVSAMILLAIVCALLYFMVSMIVKQMGDDKLLGSLIAGSMTGVQFFVLINGFITYMSVMFYSKDNEILMSMPIKPMSIYLSKFTVIYLTHVVVAALMFIPIILVVGIVAKITSVTYYVIGLFAILITPIIPLFIISLLALPMAYIVKFMRKHRALSIISVLILFVGAFIAYFFLIMSLTKINAETNDIFKGLINIFTVMGTIMYPNVILADAMIATDISILTNFLIYLGIVVGLAAISLWLSVLLYKKAVPKFMEVGVTKTKAKTIVKANSPIGALLKSEWKLISRDMTSVINYIMGIILTPIIVCIMIFGGGVADTVNDLPLILQGLILVIIFCIGSNYLAILPISREGTQYFYIKTLPIKPKDYLISKVIIANVYSIAIIVIVAIIYLIRGINPLYVGLYAIDTFMLSMGFNALSMSRDISKPNFYWTNNKELFKQSSKIYVPAFISIGFVIIIVVMMVGYEFLSNMVTKVIADVIIWSVYSALSIAACVLLQIKFYKRNTAKLASIE